jgi:hypothetical protein
MPVHSVELGHLILLNAEVQDTSESKLWLIRVRSPTQKLVYNPSDFAIINTDRNSDFEVESRLSLRDQSNRKLDLRLNYVFVLRPHLFTLVTHIFLDAIPSLVAPSKCRYIARISSLTRPGYLSV